MHRGIFQNVLRLAFITNVSYANQTCRVRMLDRVEQREYTVPIPHPAAGIDAGIYVHPELGSLVLLGWGYRETPFILATIPNGAFAQDFSDSNFTTDVAAESSGYPRLDIGELALTGKFGAQVKFANIGTIQTQFGSSKHLFDVQDRVLLSTSEVSEITDAGVTVRGKVHRDLRLKTTDAEAKEDKLTSLDFARVTSPIARDPELAPVLISSGINTPAEAHRNPALVEDRQLHYEFSREFAADIQANEIAWQSETADFSFLSKPEYRVNSRFDVLSLNVDNPNLLAERVTGTLVDVYGNLLDLNRNVIQFPRTPDPKNGADRISFLTALMRRSVKYHFELNSKKDITGKVDTTTLDKGIEFKNGNTHSRWFIDVDGEGLTKLNIPASSNIGNIPILARYVNDNLTQNNRNYSYRSPAKKDISHLQFGALKGDGIDLPKAYAPQALNQENPGTIAYRTAYHDLATTAEQILGDAPAVVESLDNTIPGTANSVAQGNAGGRSVHANLDGSLELNIGRDQADGKSIVLDTAGGIVARLGRTRDASNAASVTAQLDGNVYVQIGGDQTEVDQPVKDPTVKVFVVGSKGVDEIHITPEALILRTASGGKNIVIDSSKHLILKAQQTILLAGTTVLVHGTADDNGENPVGQRLINPKGLQV